MRRPELILGAVLATAWWATIGIFVSVSPSQLKDFAGPVATIIAASAAAFVAYRLGQNQIAVAVTQAAIAERNWRTANDRIVLDLFERRLEIFDGIRSIVGEVMRSGTAPDEVLNRYWQAIDRVPYFFGAEVQDFVETMRRNMIQLNLANTMMEDMLAPDRSKWVQKRHDEFSKVIEFYRASPALFGPYLQAHQRATTGAEIGK